MASLVTLSTPPASPVKPKSDENDNAASKVVQVTNLDKLPAPAEITDKPKPSDKNATKTGTKPKKGHSSVPPPPVLSGPSMMSTNPVGGLGPLRVQEMSPEKTLIEFISTSAAFHGVRTQTIVELERDLLKVFPQNVMPANAAAWYMAKRKYYLGNAFDYQLLPFLLRNYPKKFAINGDTVEFLEQYDKKTAKAKMTQLVRQGLMGYFSHKVAEYGVYFFDPNYYEATEPFYANLKAATNAGGRGANNARQLIPTYFSQNKGAGFHFQTHANNLVTITKEPNVEIVTNVTAVIISMVDNQFGVLQFTDRRGEPTKAFFCAKSLLKDGWRFNGDPCKLGVVTFDGYRIKPAQGADSCWYAVLVWSGRKPSPRFCATRDDLTSSTYYKRSGYNRNNFELEAPPMAAGGAAISGLIPGSRPSGCGGGDVVASAKAPGGEKINNCMQVGEVLEIHNDGVVVSLGKEVAARAWIHGWAYRHMNCNGHKFITTTQGVDLQLKDLVAFYIDPEQRVKNCDVVGFNVMVLKHSEHAVLDLSKPQGKKDDQAKPGKKSKDTAKTTAQTKGSGKKGDRRRRLSSRKKSESSGKEEDKTEKAEKTHRPPKFSYKEYVLRTELEEGYDSDVDPAFMPKMILDSDYDYDEFSEGEIDEEEVKLLTQEKEVNEWEDEAKRREFHEKLVEAEKERKQALRLARLQEKTANSAESAAGDSSDGAKATETDGAKASKKVTKPEKEEDDKKPENKAENKSARKSKKSESDKNEEKPARKTKKSESDDKPARKSKKSESDKNDEKPAPKSKRSDGDSSEAKDKPEVADKPVPQAKKSESEKAEGEKKPSNEAVTSNKEEKKGQVESSEEKLKESAPEEKKEAKEGSEASKPEE